MLKHLKNLIRRILPSSRPKYDPIHMSPDCRHKNLKPIPIYRINLTWPVKRRIVSQRHEPIRPMRDGNRKLTVVIPFRDRYGHLDEFGPVITEHLKKQGMPFEVLVIEQEFGKPFNRGMLMNIGAREVSPETAVLCFHDVDIIPMESADYRYCDHPLRPYGRLFAEHDISWLTPKDGQAFSHNFGGVTLAPRNLFEQVNGYSNEYWHWGSEDDDLLLRFLFAGIAPVYDYDGEFRMLYHEQSVFRNFDGTYTEDPAVKKMLMAQVKQNSSRYRRYRRGLGDNRPGLMDCNYEVLKRRDVHGCRIITVSV